MKSLKLIYLDEYQGELDHPYINSSDGLDVLLNSSECVLECYTSNIALYDYFRLLIQRGELDHETSCVEYRGKVFRYNAGGRTVNWPGFVNDHIEVLGSLMFRPE